MKKWKKGVITGWFFCLPFWAISANFGPDANDLFPPEFVTLCKIGSFALPIAFVAGMVAEKSNNNRPRF